MGKRGLQDVSLSKESGAQPMPMEEDFLASQYEADLRKEE
jgi:hypothetical protein